MTTVASQITSLTIVYSIVYSGADQGKHQSSASLAFVPVPGEFPTQRPVTRSFDVSFDLRPNKRLSKHSWGWWFETPSRPLWRHRYEYQAIQSTQTRTENSGVLSAVSPVLNAKRIIWNIYCTSRSMPLGAYSFSLLDSLGKVSASWYEGEHLVPLYGGNFKAAGATLIQFSPAIL